MTKLCRKVLFFLIITAPAVRADWQLVWNDEFNGSVIAATNWTFDVGNGCPSLCGWGNNELEYYTSRLENANVSGGVLHIVARKEPYLGYQYTSAKLKSLNLFSKTYGRFEFRARLPQGLGLWPALWMMPRDSAYGLWAASGEIDVMENKGIDPTTVGGTIHYGGPWPNNVFAGSSYTFPDGGSATNFHIYTLEWTTDAIAWYVDGQWSQTRTGWWSSGGSYPAPFDQPFYLIMNLAIGGNYVGNPSVNDINANTRFPNEVQVDYVRVYDSATAVSPLRISGIALNEGQVLLQATNGVPNATCYVLASADASQPASNWTRVATNLFGANGNLNATISVTRTATFYRLQVP